MFLSAKLCSAGNLSAVAGESDGRVGFPPYGRVRALVVRNWLFGWYIVEFENGGAERAELYGKALIKKLSEQLKGSNIQGTSQTNLRKFREF